MVLGKLPVPGRPTIWLTIGQGPTALAEGAGGGCLDIFTLIYHFSSFSHSLTGGPIWTEILSQKAVKPKQPTILLIWATVMQGPTVLAVGSDSGCLVIFSLVGGGRVVRWFWVNFQCRGVLQF